MEPNVSSPRNRARDLGRHGRRMARAARLALAAGLGLALVLLLGAAASLAGPLPQAAGAPGGPDATAHVQVIIQKGDHDVVARAISFTSPITQISGLQALKQTGLRVVTDASGLVCSIEGVGCPASDCFCALPKFWNYNYWDGSAWQGYMVGANDSLVADGAIEGWRWGEWGTLAWPATPVTAALRGFDWLKPRQSGTDGGYGGDGGTAEALFTVGANGYPAWTWQLAPGKPSLMSYILARAPGYTAVSAGQSGKFAAGMIATRACWPATAVQPATFYDPASGAYNTSAVWHAWAMLGTSSLSQTVPAKAVTYLANLAQANGGWEWAPGMGTDSNSTALAVQALIAAGESVTSTTITNGLAYIKSAQLPDGGFTYDPATPASGSDADSTAYAIQAIVAAGQDPASAAWSVGGKSGIGYLLTLQEPDGSFAWQAGGAGNQLATEQAVVALFGRIFPVRVAQPAVCSTGYQPLLTR